MRSMLIQLVFLMHYVAEILWCTFSVVIILCAVGDA